MPLPQHRMKIATGCRTPGTAVELAHSSIAWHDATRNPHAEVTSSRRGCRTGVRGTSRRCGGSFAKEVAGNVDKSEAPTFLRERVEIRLDENLDGLFAGINLDTNGRVAEIDLVASSVCSANDGVGHYRLA
jgi:hypothetical protein